MNSGLLTGSFVLFRVFVVQFLLVPLDSAYTFGVGFLYGSFLEEYNLLKEI